eukprot:365658-Chlamydomonas_euryale.AAC.16
MNVLAGVYRRAVHKRRLGMTQRRRVFTSKNTASGNPAAVPPGRLLGTMPAGGRSLSPLHVSGGQTALQLGDKKGTVMTLLPCHDISPATPLLLYGRDRPLACL